MQHHNQPHSAQGHRAITWIGDKAWKSDGTEGARQALLRKERWCHPINVHSLGGCRLFLSLQLSYPAPAALIVHLTCAKVFW